MNKIGIIGAMEEEVALLLEKIELEEKVEMVYKKILEEIR